MNKFASSITRSAGFAFNDSLSCVDSILSSGSGVNSHSYLSSFAIPGDSFTPIYEVGDGRWVVQDWFENRLRCSRYCWSWSFLERLDFPWISSCLVCLSVFGLAWLAACLQNEKKVSGLKLISFKAINSFFHLCQRKYIRAKRNSVVWWWRAGGCIAVEFVCQ